MIKQSSDRDRCICWGCRGNRWHSLGDNERKCTEGTTSQLWAVYQGTWRGQGAKGRTHGGGLGSGKGLPAICGEHHHCHPNPRREAALLSGPLTPLQFLPSVKEIWGQLAKGGLLGHGVGGTENGSWGGEEEKNHLLSEGGSLGLMLTLCRFTPVLEPQARVAHTSTTFYPTPPFFSCPFTHLEKKRFTTTQIWIWEILSSASLHSWPQRWQYIVQIQRLFSRPLWGFMKMGYCSW